MVGRQGLLSGDLRSPERPQISPDRAEPYGIPPGRQKDHGVLPQARQSRAQLDFSDLGPVAPEATRHCKVDRLASLAPQLAGRDKPDASSRCTSRLGIRRPAQPIQLRIWLFGMRPRRDHLPGAPRREHLERDWGRKGPRIHPWTDPGTKRRSRQLNGIPPGVSEQACRQFLPIVLPIGAIAGISKTIAEN